MPIPEFIADIEKNINLMGRGEREVVIIHHNDADGLASAAILKIALSRVGFDVKQIALERVHPPIVERIQSSFKATIIYSDLGGRAAPSISTINKGRNLTLILDHHPAEEATDLMVHNLSTELYGMSGEKDISASTATFLFGKVLNDKNKDLAYLAVVGAVGDSHDRSGHLVGENRRALLEAVKRGDIKIEGTNEKEKYILKRFGEETSVSEFASSLTTLGAVGYYADGPILGIKVCLEGPSAESSKKIKELEGVKERAFGKIIKESMGKGLKQTNHIQWFHVYDSFAPMGVKMIGEFCMYIRNRDFIDFNKYIAGFQNMHTTIPGLGEFKWNLSKISMRLPSSLEEKVVNKEMPGLAYVLPEAAKVVGGSIDACHDYAAASLIPKGLEKRLIKEMNRVIEQML